MAPRNLLYQTPYADDEWWQGGLEGTETAQAAALPWDVAEPRQAGRRDYYSSPITPTGGFGPTGRGAFQGRTDLTPQGSGMVHAAASQAYEARRPPGDVGSSYSNQPLTRNPTPQDRLGPALGLPDATQSRPASAVQAAGGMPWGIGAQPGGQPTGGAPGPPSGAPSLTGQPSKGWYARAKDYLNEPAFPRDEFGQQKPLSRGNMIGEMLMGAGQAIGTAKAGSGMLMAGLGGANQARAAARAADEQRAQQATNDWYKRIKGQADLAKGQADIAQAQRGDVKVVGNKLVRVAPDGSTEVLEEADPTAKEPSNAFQAAWQRLPPDQRTSDMAVKLQKQLSERPVTDYQRQQLELDKEGLVLRRQEANRPRGTGAAPAPSTLGKLYAEKAALPPGDPRHAAYERMIETETLRGRSNVDAVSREAGWLAPPPAALTKAADEIRTADELTDRVEGIEEMDTDLPDLMTTGAAAGGAVARWAERAGMPLATAQQQYLEKQRTLRTRMEDLTSTIRQARSGQSLTAAETASAERFLPAPGDSLTELRVKLKELKKIAAKVRQRSVDVVNPRRGIRAEREAAPEQPPPGPPPPPEPGAVVDGYRFKGGDPGSQDSWELAR